MESSVRRAVQVLGARLNRSEFRATVMGRMLATPGEDGKEVPLPNRFGRAELRSVERELLIDGQSAAIGARAFDLLLVLIERRDQVVTKNELLDLVWPGLVVEEKCTEKAARSAGDRDDSWPRIPVCAAAA
jgi:DNA-binding response OmpR family regulator